MAIFVEQPPKNFLPSTYDLYLSNLPIKYLYQGGILVDKNMRISSRDIREDYYFTWAAKDRAESSDLFVIGSHSIPMIKNEFRKASPSEYAIQYLLQEKGDLGELEFLRNHPLIWDEILEEVEYDFTALLTMHSSLGSAFVYSNSKLGASLWSDILGAKYVQAYYSKFNLINWARDTIPGINGNEIWRPTPDYADYMPMGDSSSAPTPTSNPEEISFVKQKSVNQIVIEKMTEIKF